MLTAGFGNRLLMATRSFVVLGLTMGLALGMGWALLPDGETARCRTAQTALLRHNIYRLVPDRAPAAASRFCAMNGNRVTDPALRFSAHAGR